LGHSVVSAFLWSQEVVVGAFSVVLDAVICNLRWCCLWLLRVHVNKSLGPFGRWMT